MKAVGPNAAEVQHFNGMPRRGVAKTPGRRLVPVP
jgi:hypothetical protein